MGKYTMFTDIKIRLERASHCQKCEHYRRSIKQCAECGCLVNMKVMLADSFCPIGKWGPVPPGSDMFAEIAKHAQSILFGKEADSKK
jgi:hypothetical protein